MRLPVTLLVWLGVGTTAAQAVLPVCGGEAVNALTSVSDPLYSAQDVGSGLVLSGTAEAGATAVRLRLNGGTALVSALSGQTWAVAIDAGQIEAQPDGELVFTAEVVRADASVVDAGQLTVTKNVEPPGKVGALVARESSGRVTVSWTPPPDVDFLRVRLLRSAIRPASHPGDLSGQTVVYEGSDSEVVDAGVTTGTWYWTAFAFDTALNASAPATTQLVVEAIASPVSFADDFNGCTATDGIGTGWTTQGRWYCKGDRARGESSAGLALANTQAIGDVRLSARITLTGEATGSGLVARGGYLARLVVGRGLEIVRLGSTPQVLAVQPRPVAQGVNYRLEFEVQGATLSARVDGGPSLLASDSTFAAGPAGLYSGSDWRTQFDDFQLSGLGTGSAPPPPPPDEEDPVARSYSDEFETCSVSGDPGTNWETSGVWYCRGDRLRGESRHGLATTSAVLPADVSVATRLKQTGNEGSGVVARWRDGSGYLLRVQPDGSAELLRISPSSTTVLARRAVTPPGESFHPLSLRVTGRAPVRLEAFYENARVLVHDDASTDALEGDGRAGLWSGADARTQYDFFTAGP